MGKRKEDEIQQKLVELELSIKDEEVKKNVPAAANTQSTGVSLTATNVSAADAHLTPEQKTSIDLHMFGGAALVVMSICMLLTHMTLAQTNPWWAPATGLLVIPLLVGMGMMVYDWKSKLSQAVTVGSVGMIFLVTLSFTTIRFNGMTVFDFATMSIPLCIGAALMAKAAKKRSELKK